MRIPKDHWETKNLAHRISKKMGNDFSSLLSMYLGAYRLENGKRMKEAINLMNKILKELEDLVGETLLPSK